MRRNKHRDCFKDVNRVKEAKKRWCNTTEWYDSYNRRHLGDGAAGGSRLLGVMAFGRGLCPLSTHSTVEREIRK